MAAAVPLQYRRFSRVCQRLAARIIIYFYDNRAKQYDKSVRDGGRRGGNDSLSRGVGLNNPRQAFGQRGTFSRGRDRAAPLPTHLLRICAGALKWHAPCAISKFAGGQSHTSSRQGVWGCGALRLPHDLIRLPLLFPQNSPCDFCGSPEIIPQSFCCAKSLREP